MNPKYQKPLLTIAILLLTAGYFVGSWFLLDYGEKQGDIKIMAAPLIGVMSLYVSVNLVFVVRQIFCPLPTYYTPLGGMQYQ